MRISVAFYWIILLSVFIFQLRMPHNQGGMKTDEERQAGEIAGGYTEEDGGKTQTDQILLQDIFLHEAMKELQWCYHTLKHTKQRNALVTRCSEVGCGSLTV